MSRTVVLSVNTTWNAVNFRAGLLRALLARGDRVVVFTPEDDHVPALRALGVEHHHLPMDQQGTSPRRDGMLFARYLRKLRRIRPDVFLGFTVKPNVYGSLACHALGIPVVNNVSGLGTAFIAAGPLERVVSALYRTAFRRSRRVFFQNPDDLRMFVERRLVPADRAALLPGSGIDLARFAPTPLPAGDVVTFLLVARLLRDKGVLEYVEAARILRRERSDLRFRLLGFVDAPNRTAIGRAEVDAWVAEGVIEYLGATDDVRPHLAAADCVVLPSYREGLPRTLLEGAAMARPLVATDVPGCRELVTDGVNGWTCAAKDAASLARAMGRLASASPAERTALGRASRALVERRFDEADVIARYLEATSAG